MQVDKNLFDLSNRYSREIIKLVDHSGDILYSSPSQIEILGYEDEQQSVFTGIYPEDLDGFKE